MAEMGNKRGRAPAHGSDGRSSPPPHGKRLKGVVTKIRRSELLFMHNTVEDKWHLRVYSVSLPLRVPLSVRVHTQACGWWCIRGSVLRCYGVVISRLVQQLLRIFHLPLLLRTSHSGITSCLFVCLSVCHAHVSLSLPQEHTVTHMRARARALSHENARAHMEHANKRERQRQETPRREPLVPTAIPTAAEGEGGGWGGGGGRLGGRGGPPNRPPSRPPPPPSTFGAPDSVEE